MKLASATDSQRFRDLLAREYPLRRPQNSFRIVNDVCDIRNHFIPDRHEQLNSSATFILSLCDGEHSIIDIWMRLIEKFETDDPGEALTSTVRLIRYLQRYFVLYSATIKGGQTVEIGAGQAEREPAVRIV
jgi:hypothetical protein